MTFKRLESMSSVKSSMYWDFHFSYKYTRDNEKESLKISYYGLDRVWKD